MKATGDDSTPRRDGWFEHRGTWGEVTIGTVLGSEKRTERWEVIAMAHGQQVEFGHTMWFKVREQTSGAEFNIEPKLRTASATILTLSPADTSTGDPVWPTDSDPIMLLIEELGATLLATRDEVTGEVTCPNYAAGGNHLDEIGNHALSRGLVEHLKICHGLQDHQILGDEISSLITLHGHAHSPKFPDLGKGGLPHRHVPEDLTLITGRQA